VMAELPGDTGQKAMSVGLKTAQSGFKKLWGVIKNYPKTVITLGVLSAITIASVLVIAAMVKGINRHTSGHENDFSGNKKGVVNLDDQDPEIKTNTKEKKNINQKKIDANTETQKEKELAKKHPKTARCKAILMDLKVLHGAVTRIRESDKKNGVKTHIQHAQIFRDINAVQEAIEKDLEVYEKRDGTFVTEDEIEQRIIEKDISRAEKRLQKIKDEKECKRAIGTEIANDVMDGIVTTVLSQIPQKDNKKTVKQEKQN
jgi:hypothetical protein